MNQRSIGLCYHLNAEQRIWWKLGDVCPMCGLHKKEWKRRTDWRCCSTKCTTKLENQTTYWQSLRLKVFRRDKWSCVKCGKIDIDKEGTILIGDHIIPICLGGDEWDMDNVQTLCIKCDKIKTKQDKVEIAKQRRIEKKQLNNKTFSSHNIYFKSNRPKCCP